MLKDSTAVIGLGLGGMTVTYEFQERNYLTYSVNGSEQDIKSIPNAKNSMSLKDMTVLQEIESLPMKR